jgi:NAD(P)H-hydrate epimerase
MSFDPASPRAILTIAEMQAADRAAIAAGTPGSVLMARAGAAVAEAIAARWSPRPTLILCGPGNNGGDGFIAARLLSDRGWPVRVALLGPREALRGDAADAAATWSGALEIARADALGDARLIVDALFGAGLARDLAGDARALVEAIDAHHAQVIAVDLPSGLDGDSGAIRGAAARADLTVTFARKKPAHLFAADLTGDVVVAGIGIDDAIVASVRPTLFESAPSLWRSLYPWPSRDAHKYARGHAVIWGGATMTGASRLAAHAAARMGAGLVTISAPRDVWPIYALWRADILVEPRDHLDDWKRSLGDARRNAVLLGPGGGVDAQLLAAVEAAAQKRLVLDADALSVFAGRTLPQGALLTPHEGEFKRLFAFDSDARLESVRRAAAASACTILLKGPATIVAAPDGHAVISTRGTPHLASAGTGDVLAGMCLGLVAQRVAPFVAAAIACWLHGEAARRVGPGLVAEDLPDTLRAVLSDLACGQI